MNNRDRLLELFKARAFRTGKFTLASGKESSYYINSKKVMFHSEAVWLLADAFWEMTKDLQLDAVGGLEVGAIPLTAALVQRYHQEGRALEGFFVRKQEKGHGSKERIEGVLQSGYRVAILDDVLTTGGSAMQALTEVENAGGQVRAVCCIVDRLEGARQVFEPKYPFRSIFTIRDFGVVPERPA